MFTLMDVLTVGLIIVVIGYVYMMYFQQTNSADGFSDFYPVKNELCNMPATSSDSQRSGPGPADATLDSPRIPYNLLGDYLEPAVGPGEAPRTANLTSECAYIADGQRFIEKTGSYGQITNNYKRAKPDNGSTWLHELSVSFYR